MHPLTSTLANDFVANQGKDAFGDTLAEIAFLFEKAHGWGSGLNAEEQIAQFGWTERVARLKHTDVPVRDLEQLTEELCQFILRAPTDRWVGAAAWALGKTGQASLKPVLVAALQAQVEGDPNVMYQTMIALDNLGERPFGDGASLSIGDVEQNRHAALQFLKESLR